MNWICFLDCLPTLEQEIIVYFKNKSGWHVSTAFWNGDTIVDLCEECGRLVPWTYSTIVTHWMPLPHPPARSS